MTYSESPFRSSAFPSTPRALQGRSTSDAIALAEQILRGSGAKAKVVRTGIDWRPGDVVVVRFRSEETSYTYVRGVSKWPGERQDKTDAQMDKLYADGKLTPVLESGGRPFSASRL